MAVRDTSSSKGHPATHRGGEQLAISVLPMPLHPMPSAILELAENLRFSCEYQMSPLNDLKEKHLQLVSTWQLLFHKTTVFKTFWSTFGDPFLFIRRTSSH